MSAGTDEILRIESLRKSFRSHWTFRSIEAVRGVSLGIRRGESFGFLGQNGAGKTTTMKCVMGLIRKTSGRVFLNGEELQHPRQHRIIGYLPEQPYFYDHLSVYETLDFFAQLHGYRGPERALRVRRTLAKVGLEDRGRMSVRALSKGLQQRLGFAQALINDPLLLLLDEPFSGLDPLGRKEMRELLLDACDRGATLFLSSHILSDVEDLCERVSIMARGEIRELFELKDAPRLFGETFELSVAGTLPPELAAHLRAHTATAKEHALVDRVVSDFTFRDYDTARDALSRCTAAGVLIQRFERAPAKLEDIFLQVTGLQATGKQGPTGTRPRDFRERDFREWAFR